MQMHKDTHHTGKTSITAMADSGSKVVKKKPASSQT